MTEAPTDPLQIETRRRERERRLSGSELPMLRVGGSILLSLAILLHNRYLVPYAGVSGWLMATIVLAVYALASWAVVATFLRRGRDLTVLTLYGDLLVWTFA